MSGDAPSGQQAMLKKLRRLAYTINNQIAAQEVGRAGRFSHKTIEEFAVGADSVGLGDVMAFVWVVSQCYLLSHY